MFLPPLIIWYHFCNSVITKHTSALRVGGLGLLCGSHSGCALGSRSAGSAGRFLAADQLYFALCSGPTRWGILPLPAAKELPPQPLPPPPGTALALLLLMPDLREPPTRTLAQQPFASAASPSLRVPLLPTPPPLRTGCVHHPTLLPCPESPSQAPGPPFRPKVEPRKHPVFRNRGRLRIGVARY